MVMKRLLSLSLLLLLGCGCHKAATGPGTTFYVQLVRGNDQENPPTPGARPAGPKLSKRLQCVCRWKHYWELNRGVVVVRHGEAVRTRVSPEREVEIQLLDAQNMATRIYRDGELIRSRKAPVAGTFDITGGDSGNHQSWFIVVRQDKPLDP